MKKIEFTEVQKKFINENYMKLSSRKLAAECNCSRSRIQRYMKDHGLVITDEIKEKFRREALKGRTTLTAKEEKYLLDNYLTMPIKRIGKKLGRSYTCLAHRLDVLGLKIPQEIIEKRKHAGRFQKGMVPANKGMKMEDFMSPETVKKFKANQFKKGNLPHNTADKDGVISIRETKGIKYQYIRVSIGEWKPLHHVIWEKKYGKIPKKHIVAFKDGNTMNCVIENLELITMAENMKRNTIHQYPPDLQETIKLNNKIKKILNKNE